MREVAHRSFYTTHGEFLSFHLILVKELDKPKGYVENSKQLLNTLKYFAYFEKIII